METKAVYVGGSNYVTHMEETGWTEYRAYLDEIKAIGFEMVADNGEGLDGNVFCTTFQKGSRVINITFFAQQRKMSVSVYDGPISTHLCKQKTEHAELRTTMHMLELFRLGNSFVFQLKNGHFIISDGGLAADLPYLLDYLETLVKDGMKPVIEAWVITHAHGDHCGAFCDLSKHPEWMERIYVEGVYYSEPSEEEVLRICGCEILDYEIKWVTRRLKNEAGEGTRMYRPQTGQRYYFNDITMDILLAQEQVPFGKFRSDLNTSSTVCMFTIEGQKLLFSGDIQEEGLEWLMNNYSKEYLSVDFFTLNHHGLNMSQEFAEYASAKTMLLTVRDVVPFRKIREIKQMTAKAKENVVWGDGTKIFTFPYETGTYQLIPMREWIYNEGQERTPQRNLYTCPGKLLQGWIFDADRVLLEGKSLKQGAARLLHFLKEKKVQMSAFSRMDTADLKHVMESVGIGDCFKLLLGSDVLDYNDMYLDAAQKSEESFGLEHIYKHVVLCDSLDVVKSVIKDGFKTLVPTYGREIDEELKLKCWHTFETLDTIYDFFELKKVYFEDDR